MTTSHYEVRNQALDAVLQLDGYDCIYDDLSETQDAAILVGGRTVAVMTDGTYIAL